VWCAHEYTLNNLRFALTVDGGNPDLQARYQKVAALRQSGSPTVPSTMGEERCTNPFLRWDQPALQAATGLQDPVRVFARLRGMKDQF
jgi:hydroxyacylglutathione hydrolase